MLTTYCVFRDGNHSVWFKFITNRDYDKLRPNRQTELRKLYQEREKLVDEGCTDQHPRYKEIVKITMGWEREESYRKQHVDLREEENRDIADNLYKAFLRAKTAAAQASQAFKPSAKHDYRRRVLLTRILNSYFGKANSTADLAVIERTFAKTADGLGENAVTISDNCGRDRVRGQPVEGIVKFKEATQIEANAAGRGESADDKNDLMSHYLKVGETNNIRIEFALTRTYTVDQLARVILHEATHKFGYTADYAYEGKGDIAGLTTGRAIKNADSYAYAGISVLQGKFLRKSGLH